MVEQYTLGLHETDGAPIAVIGGKGAGLSALTRIEGIRVPAGFCVTTAAFRRVLADVPAIDDRLDRLSQLGPDDRAAIRTLSAEIRRAVEGTTIPGDVAAPIVRAVGGLGEQDPFAHHP